METLISILRGINLGQRKVLMVDLKALYEELKFKDVRTYIQSGNVVFNTNTKLSDQQLAKKIEQAIFKKYAFEVPVIIRRLGELENVVKVNPFLKIENINPERLHVTFLAESPSAENLENAKGVHYPPDEFKIIDKHVFIHCPVSYGETKLSNTFFEKKLKVSATTRNWKTIGKLIELAKSE